MKKYSNYTVREFNYIEEDEKYNTIHSFEYKNKQEYHELSMVNSDNIIHRNIKLTSTYITKSTRIISNISYNYSYISYITKILILFNNISLDIAYEKKIKHIKRSISVLNHEKLIIDKLIDYCTKDL